MPQKIKRVGKWKIGDKVFKEPRSMLAIGLQARPTRQYATIVAFNADKTRAHIRYSVTQQLEWVSVRCLVEHDGDDRPSDCWKEKF